jgi:hypothetical protein
MAKGDQKRGQNKLNEQQKMSQGYLTGVQQGLGNQTGALNNAYFGSNQPQYGSTFGYGSTVPHYSPTGSPYYKGNGTDTPTRGMGQPYSTGYGGGGGQNWNEQSFSQQFGTPRTPDELIAMEGKLGEQGIKVLRNAAGVAGKVQLPDGRIVDVIQGAMRGGQGFQWLDATNGAPGQGYGNGIMQGALGDYSNLMNQYQKWADTGGYSPEDLSNIRARGVAPIRSIYDSARQGMDRNRSLQGGYSPGYNAAMSRLAREQSQTASDASTNIEAQIAEMTNQGKRFGMGGMTSMYGATPGMANMFGNQMLQSQGQQLQAAGLQNALSLGLIGAQQGQAQIPGNWMQAMKNIAGLGAAGQTVGGAIYPWV